LLGELRPTCEWCQSIFRWVSPSLFYTSSVLVNFVANASPCGMTLQSRLSLHSCHTVDSGESTHLPTWDDSPSNSIDGGNRQEQAVSQMCRTTGGSPLAAELGPASRVRCREVHPNGLHLFVDSDTFSTLRMCRQGAQHRVGRFRVRVAWPCGF